MKKPIQIAFFNHKGGVSKTTTAFHVAWKLAEMGKRVILADFDPQCNLTGLVLQYSQAEEYPFESGKSSPPLNIRDALAPAFDARPVALEPVKLQEVPDRENLFILPGHVGMAEYESTLAISHELSGSLSALQNIPGSLRWVLDITASAYDVDYIFVDMSPSLGAINQNLLMTSDAFIVPMAPDFFSAMAIRSLARVLPKWYAWSKKAAQQDILQDAAYPWPNKTPKYLGSVVQNYRRRSRNGGEAKPTVAYQKWFDELTAAKTDVLAVELRKADMLLPDEAYDKANCTIDDFLLEIPDFNSLIAISQEVSKPVFSLTSDDLNTSGTVADQQIASSKDFGDKYTDGAVKILSLEQYI